ncbi:MAG: transcriptional regulator [Eubacterium sp.]|nr:transcriptional regulator [Eubacterium sp.]
MDYYSLAGELLEVRNSRPRIRLDRTISHLLKGEIAILHYLEKHGGQAHPKDLSEELVVSTARVAVLLNTLEKDGFITRIHDSRDNRLTNVSLSEKGRELINSRREELLMYMSELLSKLGEDDAKEYVRLQKKLNMVAGDR